MMRRVLGASLLIPCLLSGVWAQDRLATNVDGVLTNMTGSTRDMSKVTNHILSVERDLVDLLLEVAARYELRYDIPADANPRETLSSYREGRDARAGAEAGFAALQEKIAALRASLEAKTDARVVKQTAEDAVVLLWSLKGHCILETLDFGNGGKVEEEPGPGGEPDYFVIGPLGRLARHNMRVRLGLLKDAVDSWADNAGGMGERRRQAELVGLNYPNATNPLWW